MKILFVCTANIVRSFMAERILMERLKKENKTDIEVSSGAIIDMDGAPPDPKAVKILLEHGLNGAGHISSLVTEDMITDADMILVMENIHREIICNQYPVSREKTYLLKSFSRDYNTAFADIKDPHQLSTHHYRTCFAEIATAIDRLLKCI